jgi:hypothetical protein
VVKLAGISLSDLKRYKNPPAFESKGGAVKNPPVDLKHPPRNFPPGREKIYSMTDEEVRHVLYRSHSIGATEALEGGS